MAAIATAPALMVRRGTLGAATKSMPRTPRDPSTVDLRRFGSLAEYNRKRHFGITPEPAGRKRASAASRPLQFVIQKHAATRLHYDLRLEYHGVMLSWAVPKGPSLDPSVKRLAMSVEEHPMDYNQFEGVIPEGEYGGGTVMIWDKGTWTPDEPDIGGKLASGHLKFTLQGSKLRGSWTLVHTRDRQWLLIKHRDRFASVLVDLTVAAPRSAVSRRSMKSIATLAHGTPRQIERAAATDPPARARVGATRTTEPLSARLPASGARSRRAARARTR